MVLTDIEIGYKHLVNLDCTLRKAVRLLSLASLSTQLKAGVDSELKWADAFLGDRILIMIIRIKRGTVAAKRFFPAYVQM